MNPAITNTYLDVIQYFIILNAKKHVIGLLKLKKIEIILQ